MLKATRGCIALVGVMAATAATHAVASQGASITTPTRITQCRPITVRYQTDVQHLRISRRGVACATADAIVSAFTSRSGTVIHRGRALNDTDWTLRRYPGWRCAVGAGGGGCSAGQDLAAYTVLGA